MRADICDVCEVIFQSGQRSEDGCAAIQFGELFEVTSTSERIKNFKFPIVRFTTGSMTKLLDY